MDSFVGVIIEGILSVFLDPLSNPDETKEKKKKKVRGRHRADAKDHDEG